MKFGDRIKFWQNNKWIKGKFIGWDCSSGYNKDTVILAETSKLQKNGVIEIYYPNAKNVELIK